MEMHTVEAKNRGLYTVDGSLHPRKDLQLVKKRKCHQGTYQDQGTTKTTRYTG